MAAKAKKDKYIIPLYKRTEKQERAFRLLNNLLVAMSCKTFIFEHPSTANYGFKIDQLKTADMNKIIDYIQTFDLTFIISSDERNRLKVTFFN